MSELDISRRVREALEAELTSALPRLREAFRQDDVTFVVNQTTAGYSEAVGVSITCSVPGQVWRSYVAGFILTTLPGAPGILLSHNAWIHEKHRGRGLGALLHRIRLAACKRAETLGMICTTAADNPAQERILTAHGWSQTGTVRTTKLWSITFDKEKP